MRFRKPILLALALAIGALNALDAAADDVVTVAETPQTTLIGQVASKVGHSIDATIDRAIDLVGIRYRRGGSDPDTGFDCSGFVRHVFSEGLGLVLPHNAKAMSHNGEVVKRDELKPGDLVFFNTMRRTFSHVGIYLGENRFIHAPATGGEVRVEDMSNRYWAKRFSGARRIEVN